jgi:hypothetical protein
LLILTAALLVFSVGIALASSEKDEETGAAMEDVERTLPSDAVVAGVVVANEALKDGTRGVDMDVLTLSAEDGKKLRDGDYSAAIVMHVLNASWPQQQIAGMKLNFKHYVTEERVRGFKERVASAYSWIKIAAEADFPFDMPKPRRFPPACSRPIPVSTAHS